MQDDFYLRLEERFRGAPEEVKERLRAYLPATKQILAIYPGALAIDVGCGRGEWLELMRDEGFQPLGIDTNAKMVEVCRSKGLQAECADAVARLAEMEPASVGVVSGFHIAEHLPFDTLMALMKEAHRVLRPGGLLILETPNPENLNVGLWTFYMDPTHRHPIPPLLLQFLGEEVGFEHNHILRLNGPPSPEKDSPPLARVAWSLSAHPDYGLVAQKSPDPQHEGIFDYFKHQQGEQQQALQQINVELEQLEREWEEREQVWRAKCEQQQQSLRAEYEQQQQGWREVNEQLQQALSQLESRKAVVEEHYQATRQQLHETQIQLHHSQAEFHDLEQRASGIYHQLMAIHNSAFWRITTMLRLTKHKLRNGLAKLRHAAIAATRAILRVALKVPGVRSLGRKTLDRFPSLRKWNSRLQGPVAMYHEPSVQPKGQNERRQRILRDIHRRIDDQAQTAKKGER